MESQRASYFLIVARWFRREQSDLWLEAKRILPLLIWSRIERRFLRLQTLEKIINNTTDTTTTTIIIDIINIIIITITTDVNDDIRHPLLPLVLPALIILSRYHRHCQRSPILSPLSLQLPHGLEAESLIRDTIVFGNIAVAVEYARFDVV